MMEFKIPDLALIALGGAIGEDYNVTNLETVDAKSAPCLRNEK
jgi:hypothetical protein